mmetsp:Transcript_129478/g.335852  ORF Transcript_129478/g.335852 Transcript_129478/m.335852 type:complete len:967 (-) Transcript_129478:160-3060(-)
MASIIAFPGAGGTAAPGLGHVGGKGMSLWRMSTVPGCTVPDGFLLTTSFFEQWFGTLREQPAWQAMLDTCQGYDPEDEGKVQALHEACEAAKVASKVLAFDAQQRIAVAGALEAMQESPQGPLSFVAVRSSSPEEDLAGMSFAGGYETVLGVKAQVEAVQEAVKHVFASCLDERVFVYKISHGISDLTPKIAAVVQRQVAARVAGVAFALDPISNCYDWATVTTNFGLGETVVSGQCSPDYFVVHKHTKAVIKKELGKKETAVWLGEDGGVYEQAGDAAQWTLSDEEVRMVTSQLVALERFYGHPIDTEFALDGQRRLMWLQARPITTHIELPPQLTTAAGHPEVLWIDIMQVVQGFTELLSVTGLSFLHTLFTDLLNTAFGLRPHNATIHNRPFTCMPESGQLYMNGSFIMRLIGFNNRDGWADKIELMDFNVAKVIRELEDASIVKSANLVPLPLCLAWNSPGLLFNVLSSRRSDLDGPTQRAKDTHAGLWGIARDLFQMRGHGGLCSAMGAFQEAERASNTSGWISGHIVIPTTEALIAEHRAKIAKVEGELHVLDLLEAVFPTLAKNLLYGLVATTVSGGLAIKNVNGMFAKAPADLQALVEDVTKGSSFVTTVLSDLLEDMVDALEESGNTLSLDQLLAAVKGEGPDLPEKAQHVWKLVIDQFGHRGVGELDMSQPRYRDDPTMLLDQVVAFLSMDKSTRPKGLAAQARLQRDVAMESLSKWLAENRGDVAEFRRQVERYHAHFRYRESGKYLIIKFVELARLETLRQAEALLQAGRIDKVEDVWLLTLDDLRRIDRDSSADVRALVAERRATRQKNAQVKSWPKVLTSRGRVLRPRPREAKEGEVLGHAVSPGVVQGRIKVLSHPREKPLLTGEILVAKATDPGWTPLFVPAAGILLEVGGALQHGALVAREFGKPCVSGIENVREQFQDGMLVEVNGTDGIVKILEQAPVSADIVVERK